MIDALLDTCAHCGDLVSATGPHTCRESEGPMGLGLLPHERPRASRQRSVAWPDFAFGRGGVRASLDDLVRHSHYEYRRSYMRATETWRGAHDDAKAWDIFRRSAPELVGAPYAMIAEAFFLGRWNEQGLPRVVLGPRRASSLMATGVAAEQMDDVLPPWRAFVVELTDSPLSLSDSEGAFTAPIDRLAVHVATHHLGTPAWTMIASTRYGVSLQRFNVQPRDWINDRLDDGSFDPVDPHSSELVDGDLRALSVMSRMIAGLCLTLSSPDVRAEAEHRGKGKSYRQRRKGPPAIRDFVLGENVRVDVREAIADYVAGGGRAPKVQSLVRGHWKQQPHGPRRELRKWVQVEAYWRGPEDAPVVTRGHKFSREDRG